MLFNLLAQWTLYVLWKYRWLVCCQFNVISFTVQFSWLYCTVTFHCDIRYVRMWKEHRGWWIIRGNNYRGMDSHPVLQQPIRLHLPRSWRSAGTWSCEHAPWRCTGLRRGRQEPLATGWRGQPCMNTVATACTVLYRCSQFCNQNRLQYRRIQILSRLAAILAWIPNTTGRRSLFEWEAGYDYCMAYCFPTCLCCLHLIK